MNIGEIVLYDGRRYYLRGLDPMGVPQRQAFLEDALTGEACAVPADDLEPEPDPLVGGTFAVGEPHEPLVFGRGSRVERVEQ